MFRSCSAFSTIGKWLPPSMSAKSAFGDRGGQEPTPLRRDRVELGVDDERRRLDAGELPDRVERTQAAHHPLRRLLDVGSGDLGEPEADPLDGRPLLEERDEGVELVALQGLWLPVPKSLDSSMALRSASSSGVRRLDIAFPNCSISSGASGGPGLRSTTAAVVAGCSAAYSAAR